MDSESQLHIVTIQFYIYKHDIFLNPVKTVCQPACNTCNILINV